MAGELIVQVERYVPGVDGADTSRMPLEGGDEHECVAFLAQFLRERGVEPTRAALVYHHADDRWGEVIGVSGIVMHDIPIPPVTA